MEEAGIGAEHTVAGQALTFGPVQVTPVGHRHALINEALPRVGNLGVVLRAKGEPSLFYPGDAYDCEPSQIDILALPLNAPWTAPATNGNVMPLARRPAADLTSGPRKAVIP